MFFTFSLQDLYLTNLIVFVSEDFLASVDDPDFLWLTANSAPWDTVKQKWVETRDLRIDFRNHCPQNTDYMDVFPALKENLGWELVSIS